MTETFTVLPLSPIRKMIAARTVEAKQTIPHFRLCADIEVDRVNALRRAQRGGRFSITDLLVKACASALMQAPGINLQWVEGEVRQLTSADVAVVVALNDGLSTPIIRNADVKSVWDIARELKDLSRRAKSNLLKTSEIFGGSFSISNLGMFEVHEFDAIINPPQCAILAVGAARASVVPRDSSATRIASILRVTLSCDHRAIDGATGARFLSTLKRLVESPEQLLDDPKPLSSLLDVKHP